MQPKIDPEIVLPALAALASAYLIVPVALISAAGARRPMVVRCPADDEPAVITRSSRHAALAVFGARDKVTSCDQHHRFPGCAQGCV